MKRAALVLTLALVALPAAAQGKKRSKRVEAKLAKIAEQLAVPIDALRAVRGERFASRKAGPMQKEVLGYLLGSFSLYIDALIERIRELGGVLEGGRPVQRIVAGAACVQVTAVSCGQCVVSGLAQEHVVASAADQGICEAGA